MFTQEGLKNIAASKYKGSPYTFVDRICDVLFWEPAVRLIPRWLAPNLITTLGALCMFSVCALTLAFNNSTLTAELPLSFWLLAILALTAYDILDNCDGKQARRTGNSSALGQLLDHGFDCSINTNAIFFLLIQALHVTNVTYSAIMLLGMEATYLIAAWEEHYMGVCRTSLGGVGVTEYGLLTRLMYFLTWWYGYAFWEQPLVWGFSRSDCWVFFTIGISVYGILTMILLVTIRTKSLRPLRDLVPLGIIVSVIAFFLYRGTLKYYTLPLMLSTASVLGEVTTVMIICTMSKVRDMQSEYPLVHKGVILFVFQAVLTAVRGEV